MELWDQTVAALQSTVKPYDFMHWIRPIRCEDIDAERAEIILKVPDVSHGRWLEEHFLDAIRAALSGVTAVEYAVRFEASELPTPAPTTNKPARRRRQHTAPQLALELDGGLPAQPDLVARYNFRTFIDGPNSRFALTAARSVADRPGTRYNPLFLYGGVGLGKTHLLHAIGHAALEDNPRARVLYVTSETYVNDLIGAIRTGAMDRFRVRYRDECDVLLIDDIQFIAGKDRTQEEFFHMFNTLHSSHKQIVMTCDQMPSAIPGLEERLRSRLQWGLIADIKPPGFETRVAILEGKAEADGIHLPGDVAMLLARHITRNVRELEGALMRLDAQARIFKRPLDLELTREILGDIADSGLRRVSPATIIKSVTVAFAISDADIKGPRRHRHVTLPRQVAMFLIRELTDSSLPHIGSLFGGRDHTTVINALKRVDLLLKADPDLRQRVDTLRVELVGGG